ncbi:MAG: hypothetical protein H6658_20525 [Ardenticatenaceae bacterium]|nr:hypothetical protein [Ardenticatenaceae bacterium]
MSQKLIMFVIGFVLILTGQVTAGETAVSPPYLNNFPTTDPEYFLTDSQNDMALSNDFLYYEQCGQGFQESFGSILRRMPINGGQTATLSSGPGDCAGYSTDDSGVYYYAAGAIVRRTPDNPLTVSIVAETSVPSSQIVIGEQSIFWISSTDNYLYHAPKDGSAPTIDNMDRLVFGGSAANNLVLGDNALYWFGDTNLYTVASDCYLYFPTLCFRESLANERGVNLFYYPAPTFNMDTFLTWVNGDKIRAYGCIVGVPPNCSVIERYDADPNGNSINIGRLAGYAGQIYWLEGSTTGFGEVKRLTIFNDAEPIAGGTGQNYSVKLPTQSGLVANNGWIYFGAYYQNVERIARIRFDAPPVFPDLTVWDMEVIQTIQSLEDDTPLVAHRPTYVRVYGQKLEGPRAFAVEAWLTVTPSGQPPRVLQPLNGTTAVLDNLPVRTLLTDNSWLFAIPPELAEGSVQLKATINPRFSASETNQGNNTLSRTVNFTRKAPICIVFIPVWTEPNVNILPGGQLAPNLLFARDMARRLLPTEDIWLHYRTQYLAEVTPRFGIPPWELGPFEMEQAFDANEVNAQLFAIDQMSNDPGRCDAVGARTHYVGVIHPDESGYAGKGMLGGDQLWFKLPPTNFAVMDWQGTRAVTLAHELGHNYGRRHVDCGNPASVGSYPYPPCDLDDGDANYHLGFNERGLMSSSRTLIKPTWAGDLMSYAHTLWPAKPRWISDFTWSGIFNEMPNYDTFVAPLAPASPTVPNLAQAADVVHITGVVDAEAGSGTLHYAWMFPTTALNTGLLAKWQGVTAVSHRTNNAGSNYHLRLLAANNSIVDDLTITPQLQMDGGSGQSFAVAFPAPETAVAKLQLMDGNTILDTLQPSGSSPVVNILTPAGSETFNDQMTITVQATDANADDDLLFTIQYSPDQGNSWQTIVTNFPNLSGTDTLTLDLADISDLPASSDGLIRVAVSDGYHTGLATSAAFTVSNRPPMVAVSSPQPEQSFPAGQPIRLQGWGMDVEDGVLEDVALNWKMDGVTVGVGEEMTLAGLASGEYTVDLVGEDMEGAETWTSVTFTVQPLIVPDNDATLELDGFCDDDGYETAVSLPLAPYNDGYQATGLLVRDGEYLWLCVTNMKRTPPGASVPSVAVLRVDVNNSDEALPQPGDYILVLGEDGIPITYTGNGTVFVPGPGGASARVSANDAVWSGEMRVEAAVLGGWYHEVGLALEQVWSGQTPSHFYWPYSAEYADPGSWGTAVLGQRTTYLPFIQK